MSARIREPDLVIEGEIPVWQCQHVDYRTKEPCPQLAVVADTWWHFSMGPSTYTQCEEHRFKGGVITADMNGVTSQRLSARVSGETGEFERTALGAGTPATKGREE